MGNKPAIPNPSASLNHSSDLAVMEAATRVAVAARFFDVVSPTKSPFFDVVSLIESSTRLVLPEPSTQASASHNTSILQSLTPVNTIPSSMITQASISSSSTITQASTSYSTMIPQPTEITNNDNDFSVKKEFGLGLGVGFGIALLFAFLVTWWLLKRQKRISTDGRSECQPGLAVDSDMEEHECQEGVVVDGEPGVLVGKARSS